MAHLFGEIALDLKQSSPEQLNRALEKQQSLRRSQARTRLGEVFLMMGVLNADQIKNILHEQRKRREDDAKAITIKKIGRYRIVEKLGEGGMGSVFKATDAIANQTVALKVLLKQFSGNTSFGQRFTREASIAASLRHENIVSCLDFGVDQGMQFLVMEFVEGQTLREKLNESGPFSEHDALKAGRSIASALTVAHAKGVVHRDVRPENVILTKDGILKLTDFGTAKSFLDDDSLSRTGVVIGTPYYMSPEQIRSEKVIDQRADLYALGASMYLLLTAKVPFDSPRKLDIMQKHLTETPAPISKFAPQVSAGTIAIVNKLMAKEPGARYQSAQDLIADIDRVLRGEQPTLTSIGVVPASRDDAGQKRGCLRSLFFLVAALLGSAFALEHVFPRERAVSSGKDIGRAPSKGIISRN